jgi:hypothetical protein
MFVNLEPVHDCSCRKIVLSGPGGGDPLPGHSKTGEQQKEREKGAQKAPETGKGQKTGLSSSVILTVFQEKSKGASQGNRIYFQARLFP